MIIRKYQTSSILRNKNNEKVELNLSPSALSDGSINPTPIRSRYIEYGLNNKSLILRGTYIVKYYRGAFKSGEPPSEGTTLGCKRK